MISKHTFSNEIFDQNCHKKYQQFVFQPNESMLAKKKKDNKE
jgi:hypothetical protein